MNYVKINLSIVLAMLVTGTSCFPVSANENETNKTNNKMKVEIWSDVVCPFCYIGKRKFEAALEDFEHADDIEIVWKSYQLSPNRDTDTSLNAYENLALEKGISIEQSEKMHEYVTDMAKTVGLNYRFDLAIPVNTFNAHSFIQFAKKYGKQGQAKELVMKSYFLEGKNVDDIETLKNFAVLLKMDANALENDLKTRAFEESIQKDVQQGYSRGLQGVPFFLINGKHTISGAQDSRVFLKTLEKAYGEWVSDQPN